MRVLGIETSCDETAVAVFDEQQGLLSHTLHSQLALHQPYGGVVPELAARDHVRKVLPLVDLALKESNSTPKQIHAVAFTTGPGLIGALMVGAMHGAALAFGWDVPAIGIHHLEGHLLAPMLEPNPPPFPFAALLVSGGHTLLIEVLALGNYKILGESLDDAVGEAFDKTAKLLGLPYPGGPEIARLAKQGNPTRFNFPRPLLESANLDMSFSGLKTHAATTWRASDQSEQTKADIALAFEEAATDVLINKCQRLLHLTGMTRLVIAGGVGANLRLREKLENLCQHTQTKLFFPRIDFCTDNGAMVAYAGLLRLKANCTDGLIVNIQPRWSLEDMR